MASINFWLFQGENRGIVEHNSRNGSESPVSVPVIKSVGVVEDHDDDPDYHPTVTASLAGLSSLGVAGTK